MSWSRTTGFIKPRPSSSGEQLTHDWCCCGCQRIVRAPIPESGPLEMCMTSAHGTTNGSAYAIWWAMLGGTSTQTDRGCTRCPIFMRSLRSQPLSSALRLKNNIREQHECTNLMHSDLGGASAAML